MCENSVSPVFAESSPSSLISHTLPQLSQNSSVPFEDILYSVEQAGH
jgi:hypothetical protein